MRGISWGTYESLVRELEEFVAMRTSGATDTAILLQFAKWVRSGR